MKKPSVTPFIFINRLLVAFILSNIFCLPSFSQVPTFQDCLGAQPICLGTFVNGNIITGTGNILNEINPATSCLLTGERNDAWYIVTTSTSGNLAFTIVPNNPLHNYDWAVYNLTSAVCSDIFTNSALEVACNYSNIPGNTGANNLPGLQNGTVIPVTNGQTYLINVSGFSAIQQNGYTIDLTGSSAMITDNTNPVLSSVTAMNCGATNLSLSFSERVLCNTVQPTDFTLTGPGGPYVVSAVSGNGCALNGTYSRDFTLSFSPALLSAGNYTLSLVNPVTDLCGNATTIPQSFVFSIAPLNITFQKVDVTCFGGNNGSATTNITGPAGPYSYQWSPSGGNGPSAQWLTAGTYMVTVTSALGCSSTASVTINQPLTGLTASVVTTPANGCASNGTASVSVSNGQAPFLYSWWPTGGNGSSANNLAAGSYMVTITDANQCVLNYFFNITSVSGPSVSINNFNGVSCNGGNDGNATVTVTGASGPFSYQWSPQGGNSATASGLTSGNYSVVVTVAPGCTLTATVAITQPPTALNVIGNATNTSCGNNNGSIILNTSGGVTPYVYQWSPAVASTSSALNLPGGTYTITVSDANGCTQSVNYSIVPSTQPVLTLINHSDVSCFGQTNGATGVSIFGGTLPLNILWSSGQTTNLLNSVAAGTYTVTVTDAFGCSASLTDVITQPTLLTATIQNLQNINCFGDLSGSASISTTGGNGINTYTWTGNSSTGASINNVAAGIYIVTITDQKGCTASVPVTISSPAAPINIQENITATTCGNSDGSILINTSGGTPPYSFLWSNGANSATINSLNAGIYTLTVTDTNGCFKTNSYAVQSSNAPVISILNISNVNCSGGNNGNASLSASGGTTPYTWQWQGGISNNNSASNLMAGNYNVTVTDGGGCSSYQVITISEPPPINIQLSVPVTICIGENTVISANISGGNAPYNYLWNNAASSAQQIVNPSITTSYTLTVTDNNGCVVISNALPITVNAPLLVTATYPDSVCKGNTAVVTLNASGGDGNYSYNWSNGLSGSQNSITISQNTLINITTSDGCSTPSALTSVSITAVDAPSINFNLAQQSGCEPLLTNFAVPNIQPGYNYLWNFGDNYNSSLATPSHIYNISGLFDVSLTVSYSSASACVTQLNFPAAVNVYPKPRARFIYDPTVPTLNHSEVFFSDRSTGSVWWLWQFGDMSDEVRDQNARHTYKDTGLYVVKLQVQSIEGCADSTFEIIHVSDELQFFIPNAFTPDQSGVNDYFKVYGVGFRGYEISIFDRWGKLVHYAKNREEAWDGKDESGNLLPQGIYVYKVTITDNEGNLHHRFDHVTLIR